MSLRQLPQELQIRRTSRDEDLMPLLIKICGLSTPEALDAALEAGAGEGGFVVFSPSPRHLGFQAAPPLGPPARDPAPKVSPPGDAPGDWRAPVVQGARAP